MCPLISILSLMVVSAAPPACPEGKAVSPDTAGQCCWPQQAWSASRKVCVGTPACPAGMKAQGEECAVACEAGKEAGPDTAGHCCWPQQVWSAGRQQCVGIPRCPAGLEAQGESCAAAAAAPPPAPAPPPPDAPRAAPAPAPEAAVTPPAAGPDGAPAGFHYEKQRIKALIISGAAVLGAGYLLALLTELGAALYVAATGPNNCLSTVVSYGWVPVVGPAVSVVAQDGLYRDSTRNFPCTKEPPYPFGVALAAIDTVLQVAGLGLLVTGIVVRRDVLVENEPAATSSAGEGLRWHLALGAPRSTVGLSFALTGF